MRLLMILVMFMYAFPAWASSKQPSCPKGQADGSCESAASLLKCRWLAVDGTCAVYDVSIVDLIANPLAYDGKQVQVIGYLVLEFEGNSVYLHREDYEMNISRNGLWVSLAKDASKAESQCKSGNYVLLLGKFNANNRGHMDMWSGSIENVSKCLMWPPDVVREKRLQEKPIR